MRLSPAVAPPGAVLGTHNLRDIGGHRTAAGRRMRTGLVYRSGALALDESDLATVASLGLVAVHDLRTPGEVAAAPDMLPPGTSYHHHNVYGAEDLSGPMPADANAARQAMIKLYRGFVTGEPERAAVRDVLSDLASAAGPSLIHCTSGKDRTGWIAAVLQLLAGVPQPTVMQDFLRSNEFVHDSAPVQAMLSAAPPAHAAVFAQFAVVAPEYLDAALAQLRNSYGSARDYAIRGAGLDASTVVALTTRLLEPSVADRKNLSGPGE